jgi:hypothetical protein
LSEKRSPPGRSILPTCVPSRNTRYPDSSLELDAPHTTSIRDEENAVALTLGLDGAAGAVVSELDDVVKVVVVIGDMLLARSIAIMRLFELNRDAVTVW